MQFELEATVLNGKVVTNAKELLANIDNGLKHYDYVVTENTYEQAIEFHCEDGFRRT